ncbi:hypothetical protein C2134_20290 [Chromobacterium sinusclupearum]|uniref:DUF4062 domain-containing protein n=1 Tax=Chromobacterium sinusclupearum TaxID=2077146 RepID=A0A2K4MIH3_9NEIS|nr:DUF4062 domain-containing protein [Chromobacterium sinusclupearum]POA96886.1 hypothetical protein C2134_20290 [Chromobacterium sinusclupearum]
MQKRYQVFLSSTFRDLEVERLEVMRALLELDCFPCGMEYFPASSDDQWSFIKDLIDQCDYYVVVIAGRYGSVDAEGISFTEKEYRYALEKGIPVLGFVHADPSQIPNGKSELEPEAQKRLEQFRALVQTRLCKEWKTAAELGAVVSRSLTQLIRRTPRPGWVRADQLASTEAAVEIVRLRQLNDQLTQELGKLSVARPTGSEELAQDDDRVELAFTVTLTDRSEGYPYQYQRVASTGLFSWRELLVACGPYLLSESKLSNIKSALNRILKEKAFPDISASYPNLDFSAVAIHESSLQLVIVQFTALGYLQISTTRDESGKELRTAVLTPLGRSELMAASAVRRGVKVTSETKN